jgi:DNA-binding transcriptional LysR family regulator
VLSLTFFPKWLKAIESRDLLEATVRLTAAHMAACEQIMLRGEAQFLLCHHHPQASHMLMPDQFRSIHLGTDVLLPVSAPRPDGTGPLFPLASASEAPLPLLTYTGESGLGRILAATRAVEQSGASLRPVFSSHLTSVLTAMARDARGLTWAPLSIVSEDLEQGRLVRAADANGDIPIEIRLYRPRARQSPTAERFWVLVAGCDQNRRLEEDSEARFSEPRLGR